jgi:hypothetical protein
MDGVSASIATPDLGDGPSRVARRVHHHPNAGLAPMRRCTFTNRPLSSPAHHDRF